MKRGIFFLTFLVLLELASAEIIIDNVEGTYNIGDELNLSFSIEKQKSISDYLEVYLDCSERELVHKKYYSIEKDKKRNFEIKFPATTVGECYVEVVFNNENEESSSFKVSNNINIETSINNKLFFPNENLIINGTAKKESGEPLDGIVEISLEKIENKTIEVTGGHFFAEFKIKPGMLPGKYNLEIEAIEKNIEEEIINRGTSEEEIEIKSSPTYLDINSINSTPPSEFSAKINLLDQARNIINNETVIVKLLDPNAQEAASSNVKSGEIFYYTFPENAERGFWKIRAYYGNIFYEKPVNIEANKKIDFKIVEERGKTYLEITNIGNVFYEGNFQAVLENSTDNQPLFVNVSLGLGEKELYLLNDKIDKGNYTLTVDGKTYSAMITGAAISRDLTISPISYIFFFILILIILFAYLILRAIKWKKKDRGIFTKFHRTEKKEKKAFMILMKFDKFPEEVSEIVQKEGLSLSKVSDNLYYILFYETHRSNPEFSAYTLAKRIRNKSLSKMSGVGIVVNSGTFYDKEKFLKNFSLNTRKMVEHTKGGILISKEIAEKTKIKTKSSVKFKHEGEVFEMFRV